MKLNPILFFVTVLTATGQLLAQTTVLTDDFNDGAVDAEKWDIILPFGGSAISEANGVLTTAERGTLFTKEEMPANLEVTGSFQMNHDSEHFKVVLRSDGNIVDSNTVAERKGISFAFSNDGDQIAIQRQGPDEFEILAVKSYPLTTGQSYSFRIVANGDSLSLSVNGTEELTASSSYSAGNLVGIYSRELAGRSSDVDSLSIKNLTSWTVPGTINYQGRLTDGNSDPVTGNVSMNLKLFDAATGGSELYSENIGTVTLDENGVYSFQFGTGGIAGVLTSANSHWLELSIDGTAQSPRERILSVPFAQIAGSVPDGSITSSKLAPGTAATILESGGLRIVRGSGAADGTLLQGEGFTVGRQSFGIYLVTFNEAFQSNPTVVVTSDIEGSRNGHAGASISSLTPNGFRIRTNQTDTSPLSFDAKWHFIAIGQ
jgi:hypothetical protein